MIRIPQYVKEVFISLKVDPLTNLYEIKSSLDDDGNVGGGGGDVLVVVGDDDGGVFDKGGGGDLQEGAKIT